MPDHGCHFRSGFPLYILCCPTAALKRERSTQEGWQILACRWRFLASAGGPGRPISIDRQGLGILWVMSQVLLRIAAIAQRSARDPARSPRLFKIGLEPATPNRPRDLWPIQTPCRSSAEHCAFFRFRVCRSSITDLWSIVPLYTLRYRPRSRPRSRPT